MTTSNRTAKVATFLPVFGFPAITAATMMHPRVGRRSKVNALIY